MNAATLDNCFSPDASAVEAALETAGFERKGKGFRRGDLTFEAKPGWFVLRKPLAPDTDPNDWLGRPGLWKPASLGGKNACLVFSFPEIALEQPGLDPLAAAPEQCPFQACLDWALASENGEEPKNWVAPEADELDAWGGDQALFIVQIADVLRKIELTTGPETLALRLKLESAVSAELPQHRRHWLNRVLAEARDQWRLARTGFEIHGDHVDAVAEVNLTGVPAPCAHRLFLASVDTLRWIASALVPTVEFLASDAAQASSALEICELKG